MGSKQLAGLSTGHASPAHLSSTRSHCAAFSLPSAALSPLTENSNALFPVICLQGFQVSPTFQGSFDIK